MIDYRLVLDLITALLLGVTITYAVILNRRLSGFRKQKQEMETFIALFDEATGRAGASLHRLKAMAEQTGGDLQGNVDKASALFDELSFMVDRGNAIADRLEQTASSANKATRAKRDIGIETIADEEEAARLAVSRIVEAAEANQQTAARQPRRAEPEPPPAPSRPSGLSPSGLSAPDPSPGTPAPVTEPRPPADDEARSQAERELLKALRSVR